jgi:lipopolysaccharide/colanic/teichoic acid biosynthesis glycosyltransferase
LKRLLDVILSSAGLIVFSPLLVLVAALIKIESRGSVFYAHRREGRGGKDFLCLKFRTMVADASRYRRKLAPQNEVDGPQFKLKNDPRVTPLGRLLRATNVDELPQLVNVLLGHMSLVGPRPSPFQENQICVPWRKARLSVRPGITGLWQVCRNNRDKGDFNQWIDYDIAYVRHFSIWLDLKILLATLVTLGGQWSVPPYWMVPVPSNSMSAPGVSAGSSGRELATL